MAAAASSTAADINSAEPKFDGVRLMIISCAVFGVPTLIRRLGPEGLRPWPF
jgi:hypothetical protein